MFSFVPQSKIFLLLLSLNWLDLPPRMHSVVSLCLGQVILIPTASTMKRFICGTILSKFLLQKSNLSLLFYKTKGSFKVVPFKCFVQNSYVIIAKMKLRNEINLRLNCVCKSEVRVCFT